MSSIGPSSRVPRLDPPKSGEGRRQPDDTREGGGDTLSDSGGGRQFGGYGGDSGQRTGGRGGDLASSRGDGDAHGGEAGASPDLARRADDALASPLRPERAPIDLGSLDRLGIGHDRPIKPDGGVIDHPIITVHGKP